MKVKESREYICLKFLSSFLHFVHVACYQLKLEVIHEKSVAGRNWEQKTRNGGQCEDKRFGGEIYHCAGWRRGEGQ